MSHNLTKDFKRPSIESILSKHSIQIVKKGIQSFISCPNPDHADKNPSCLLTLDKPKQTFHCFACDVHGDVFDLIALIERKDLKSVLANFRQNSYYSTKKQQIIHDKNSLESLCSRWLWAMKKNQKIDQKSQIEAIYPIHLSSDNHPLVGLMLRLNPKEFKQLSIVENLRKKGEKKLISTLKLGEQKMMPFGWQKAKKFEKIFICEGQKACLALEKVSKNQFGILSLLGTSSAKKIDWSLVADKEIYLWADNDKAGQQLMLKLKGIISPFQPKSCCIINPDFLDKKEKDDAFDYIEFLKKEKKEFDLEELLKGCENTSTILFKDFDEEGNILDTTQNFKIMCEFFHVKPMIDLYSREYGLINLKTQEILYDGDVVDICRRSRFPATFRQSFIEATIKREKNYFNRFLENLKKVTPDEIEILEMDTTEIKTSLLSQVIDCIEVKEHVFSHLTQNAFSEEEKQQIQKKWVYKILKTWFKLAYYQGSNHDKKSLTMRTVLLLKGFQSIGKSRFFDAITPEGFYHEGAGLPQDGDEKDQITQSFITELGEFDSFSANDQKRSKNMISTKKDKYRKKYGRETLTFPRVTTFVATTNRNKFFRDSENTRFWTLNLSKINREKLSEILKTEKDKWRLWREIQMIFEYEGSEDKLFRETEIINESVFELENEQYRFKDYCEDLVEDAFDVERMRKGDFEYYLKKKDLYKLISYGESNLITSKEMSYAIESFYERIKQMSSRIVKVKLYNNESSLKKPLYVYPISLNKDDKKLFEFIKEFLYVK